jgi:DNA-binding response OmpR family regulator
VSENKGTIVLVDDDQRILLTVGDCLQLDGYTVIRLDSAEKCLKELKRTTPDLLIVDLGMPGKGGIALINDLCGPDRRLSHPVLVFTAHNATEAFFKDTPIDGFVRKTDGPDVLLREVRRVIAAHRGAAPASAAG